ncbi:hypothetical protein [Nocardioides sp. YIM 152588]|uniref:hypothetical protein n=1 Tax=Nocardioides sp. YIM 152588 TaxID=3158259 RepID=UPI0032E3ACC5
MSGTTPPAPGRPDHGPGGSPTIGWTRWAVAAGVALGAVGIGVGVQASSTADSQPFERYCETVAEQRAVVGAALEAGPTTGLIRALPSFERLADEAPRDIADEWTQVNGAIQRLVDALDDAGVDPASYRREAPPAGLTADERASIDAAATALGAASTVAAMGAVEQQARDVCGSPLSL